MSRRKQQINKRQKRSEWLLVTVIFVAIVAMIGLGIAYQQDYFSQPAKPVSTESQPPANKALTQTCQQKLKEYLAQGGVDIAQKMHYGDLRGCDFSSSAEKEAREADPTKRSFNISPN